jgi:superkiller protein 3
MSHAKEAIQLDPLDAWAHYELTRALNRLRRFTEAVTEAKASLRLSDGKYGDMHFELGSAYFELKDWAEAVQAYQKAATISPKDPSAAYNVAVSFYNEQYYNDALMWYREVLRRNPDQSLHEQAQRMINALSR